MKKIIPLLLTAALMLSTAACSGTSTSSTASTNGSSAAASSAAPVSGSISIDGSSALYPLVQDATEKFNVNNPDASITLNAGGSGTGLKDVAAGTVDIGMSDVFADEKLDADKASSLVDHKVCVITMAPIVSKDIGDKVKSLTTQQLIDIFTAKTTNWKDVGGPDEDIILVTRPTTSGTRALFKSYALNGNEEASGQTYETDDSGTLLQTVSGHNGAIGYVALSYLVNNTSVDTMSIDGVAPTLENTYSGKYKVWGYEHMYTKGNAAGVSDALIKYMQSDEYGKIMESLGYNVASKMQVTRQDPGAPASK